MQYCYIFILFILYMQVEEEQENLRKRQEELERKAAELQRKEQELQRMQFGGTEQ